MIQRDPRNLALIGPLGWVSNLYEETKRMLGYGD